MATVGEIGITGMLQVSLVQTINVQRITMFVMRSWLTAVFLF